MADNNDNMAARNRLLRERAEKLNLQGVLDESGLLTASAFQFDQGATAFRSVAQAYTSSGQASEVNRSIDTAVATLKALGIEAKRTPALPKFMGPARSAGGVGKPQYSDSLYIPLTDTLFDAAKELLTRQLSHVYETALLSHEHGEVSKQAKRNIEVRALELAQEKAAERFDARRARG